MAFVRKHPFLCVLFLGLALRLFVFVRFLFCPDLFLTDDSMGYIDLARGLLEYGEFRMLGSAAGDYETFRTPFYPLYISVLFKLFGDSVLLILFSQIGLGLLSIVLTWRFAHEAFHPYAGIVAALVLATNSEHIFYGNVILTEALSTTLCIASLYFASRFVNRGTYPYLVLSGLALGFAVLTRPFFMYCFPAFVVYVALGMRGKFLKRFGAALVWLAPYVLVVGCWILRNWLVIGLPAVTSIGSENLLQTRAGKIYQVKYDLTAGEAIERLHTELAQRAEGENWTPQDYTEQTQKFAVEIMRENLTIFLRGGLDPVLGLYLVSDHSFFTPFWHGVSLRPDELPRWERFLGQALGRTPMQILLWLVYLLGGIGLVGLIRMRRWGEAAFFALILLYPIVVLFGGNTGLPRYRVPFMPYIACLAGMGLARFAFRFQERMTLAPLSPDKRRTVLCLPVYNEVDKITRLLETFPFSIVDKVIVVDDASSDGTEKVLQKYPVHIIRHDSNRGVGVAIRDVIEYGQENDFDIVVVMAGNGKDDPYEIPKLLEPILEDGAAYVQGSRFHEGGHHENTPRFRLVAIKLYTFFFNVLSPFYGTDLTNGFRAYRIDLFTDERIDIRQRWLERYEMEYFIHFKAVMLDYPVAEVPVSKCYPAEKGVSYSKIRPLLDWWKMVRPMVLLFLRLKH